MGLTDMHWFYPEDKVSRVGRGLGIILVVVGLPLTAVSAASLFPPNSFAAMRQAETYLHTQYGDSNGEASLSCNPMDKSDKVVIKYEYAEKQVF